MTELSQTPRIAFIGAGNMAGSLIGGLLTKNFSNKDICASDPHETTRQKLAKQFEVAVTENNNQAIESADVVVLAVKPQAMKQVTQDIAEKIQQTNPLVISIAAGINVKSLQAWLGKQTAIVRCMPNTPALFQLGATGLFANGYVTDIQKKLAKNILDAVGVSIWLNREDMLDIVTAVSGSGPAYYFLLMEAMIDAGIAQGLDAETAKQLVLQTALGAATMASRSEESPAELRNKVTSPNGTTQEAILSFQKNGFEKIVQQAVKAAADRSVTLSEELGE